MLTARSSLVHWSINFGQDARLSLAQPGGSLRVGLARLWLSIS